MTMLGNIPPFPPAMARDVAGNLAGDLAQIRSGPGSLLVSRCKWLVDRIVAAAIARHQRQVELFVLRNLTDRELKDIGIYRDQLGSGLADAARARAQLRDVECR
jgi:uncharacterized protein YjiS (DUF1127 family)